tara:strand:+ start:776 stop:949 length:174 start_codon:yes stop_codon:yes gene_type:complete
MRPIAGIKKCVVVSGLINKLESFVIEMHKSPADFDKLKLRNWAGEVVGDTIRQYCFS